MAKHVEMINEYLVEDDSDDFEFFDNHGLLIRCGDCKSRCKRDSWCEVLSRTVNKDFYCGYGERKEELW